MKLLKALVVLLMLTNALEAYAGSESCAEFLKADKELNDTYQEIQSKYRGDTLFLKKLKNAQTAWIAFRDAQVEALYPAKDKTLEYGSIYSECNCLEQNALTAARVIDLKKWLVKIPEGEMCRGSRK
jgi:uncharacterized protein YecT (DUF1311 family)